MNESKSESESEMPAHHSQIVFRHKIWPREIAPEAIARMEKTCRLIGSSPSEIDQCGAAAIFNVCTLSQIVLLRRFFVTWRHEFKSPHPEELKTFNLWAAATLPKPLTFLCFCNGDLHPSFTKSALMANGGFSAGDAEWYWDKFIAVWSNQFHWPN